MGAGVCQAYVCPCACGNTETVYMSYLGKYVREDMSAGVLLMKRDDYRKEGIDKRV